MRRGLLEHLHAFDWHGWRLKEVRDEADGWVTAILYYHDSRCLMSYMHDDMRKVCRKLALGLREFNGDHSVYFDVRSGVVRIVMF